MPYLSVMDVWNVICRICIVDSKNGCVRFCVWMRDGGAMSADTGSCQREAGRQKNGGERGDSMDRSIFTFC